MPNTEGGFPSPPPPATAPMPFAALAQRMITRRQLLQLLLYLPAACAMRGDVQLPPWSSPPPALPSPQFCGSEALAHATAQMTFGPRIPGTPAWRQCGEYILEQLATYGWAVESQPFRSMATDCRNLIGKSGSGPLLIIGAHYDTRRLADRDPDPACRAQPVPGANDGASGVAVLLELARVVRPQELGRTIWLVAFDAEDQGGIDGWEWIAGSRYFVHVLDTPVQGMVLVDMVGDADQQLYYEGHSHPDMSRGIWEVANQLGYTSFVPEYRYTMLDDHLPFVQAGIPAVDLIDFDYPFWHTTHDTLDKVSATSLEAVGRTLEAWLVGGAVGLPAPSARHRVHVPVVWR